MFSNSEYEGVFTVLLVDALKAFNGLNCQLALINTSHLYPPLSQVLINTYRSDTELFSGDDTILSSEGITQGDPLAMAMYVVVTVTLIMFIISARQVWYADNAAACTSLLQWHRWWDLLNQFGPFYGYFTNARKTHLVVKLKSL